MKLLALLSACKPIGIGIAGLAIIGGGASAVLNINHEENPTPQIATLEEVEIEVPTLDVEIEVVDEETEGTEEKVEVTPPHTEASQAPTKQPSNLPKASDSPTITKEDPHGAASYNGMSRIQYEDAVKYTCPSQREENIFETWRPAMSRLISIGRYSKYVGGPVPHNTSTSYTAYYSNEAARVLELTWDEAKINKQSSSRAYIDIENTIVQFYFDWDNLIVSWGKKDRDKAPVNVAETANLLADSLTSHLHYIDSSYKSRCPND